MSATTITEDQIAKADRAARQAQQKAQELRTQQQQAEEAKARAHQEAVTDYEVTRQGEFEEKFAQEVTDTRAAFVAAVAEGGNVAAAWVAYVKAQHVALVELTRIQRRTLGAARSIYRVWEEQVRDWNKRCSLLVTRQLGGFNVTRDLADLNTEITEGTEDAPHQLERTPDATQPVDIRDLGLVRPSEGISEQSSREKRFSDTDFTIAFNKAVEEIAQKAAEDHEQQVREEISRLTS